MKKLSFFTILLIGTSSLATSAPTVEVNQITILYNEGLFDWYYTPDCSEAQNLVGKRKYNRAGRGFGLLKNAGEGLVPLYHLTRASTHLYTTSQNAGGDASFHLEGAIGYVYQQAGPNRRALIAYKHLATSTYMYGGTSSFSSERAIKIKGFELGSGYGIQAGGIVGYVLENYPDTCNPWAQIPPSRPPSPRPVPGCATNDCGNPPH